MLTVEVDSYLHMVIYATTADKVWCQHGQPVVLL